MFIHFFWKQIGSGVLAVFKTVGRVEAPGGSIPPSSVTKMNKEQLANLPQIETLLQEPEIQNWSRRLGRPVVTEAARSVIASIRKSVLQEERELPPLTQIIVELVETCLKIEKDRLQKVINATGVIIHTNMGRSPLPRDVWRETEEINCGYSNLELNLGTGKRGKRKGLIPLLLSKLTGAEDALVVNNNAAAVLLILQTFAVGKEVIVSRGEQVQIGGGFRIPEILAQSGAGLVEIGTTNITTGEDYQRAFTEETSMILSVHRSNFAIRGFTSSPGTAELVRIKPENVLLCVDQGSGVVDESLPGETSVRSHLKDGADLVCFSGDKMFGGPQAGIIVGRKDLISRLEHHPMMRAFRPGKTVYSLLEAILVRRLNGEENRTSQALAIEETELKKRGRRLLQGIDRSKASLIDSSFTTGGGTLPDESFPSLSVQLHSELQADRLLKKLRDATPPVIGTISNDAVELNLATIENEDVPHIRALLKEILGA